MSNNPFIGLKELGQSVWLDNLSRKLINSGELRRLIDEDGLSGITSNPTIFQKAISGSINHDASLRRMIDKVIKDEKEHERKLIDLIDEERLRYIGSMVLGMNDVLVELTGALAGFTLAFRNTHLIAMAGFITGIAASLSMATSAYLFN